ncbi:MAG TPA: hypothetical protein VFV67_34105 [Actinophytocola sp.]|uniref:hypothetical protein n=1 Tax=Actinophytocola sp. TaxID=1872138 RepID=UPI002DB7F515|nr:hypothetical protein [Actinophytocola sp.]HEU5475702.1 hypothetical protein [Actinophytocola sp.]
MLMPWLAQYEDLPETHWHFADPGSDLEKAFTAIGYVVVRPDPPAEPDEPVTVTSVELTETEQEVDRQVAEASSLSNAEPAPAPRPARPRKR